MTTTWLDQIRGVSALTAAETLGFDPAFGRGRQARWRLAHGDCPGQHSDGEPTVFYGSRHDVLVCRACGGAISALDLLATSRGVDLPKGRWPHGLARTLRAAAASLGWCTPPEATPVDEARWAREMAQAAAERRAAEEQAAAERRAVAIHVAAAWPRLAGKVGVEVPTAWMQARGVDRELVDNLPVDDLAGAPTSHTPLGLPQSALAILDAAAAVDRRVLIALRDADGVVQSVERRWHRPGQPPDGRAKALALPSASIYAGEAYRWGGGVRMFGHMPAAAAACAAGLPIILTEGGPDYLVAAAAGAIGGALALGCCGADEMANVAQVLRGRLRAALSGSGWLPRVAICSDRGRAGERAGADAARILRQTADVIRVPLPGDMDDLGDFAHGAPARDVIGVLLRGE